MSTATTPEIWNDPMGRPAELHYVGLTDFDGEPWFAESPGHLHPRTYRMVAVHNRRLHLDITVFPVEPWSPYDAISDRLLAEGWEAPAPTEDELAVCEHGMSASLCAGPNHYPAD